MKLLYLLMHNDCWGPLMSQDSVWICVQLIAVHNTTYLGRLYTMQAGSKAMLDYPLPLYLVSCSHTNLMPALLQ